MHRMLVLISLITSVRAEQRIRAEAGQDSVILPCGAGEETEIRAVEWSRLDLYPDGVLFYRDGHFESDYQHPSFRNRVDLQDRQMKDGNVSLILKDVKINDAGTYECRVYEGGGGQRRCIFKTSIHFVVSPPGTQEGGDEEGGGKEERRDKEGGPAGRGHLVLVSVLGIVVIAVAVSAAVWILKRPVKKNSAPPDEEATVRRLVQTQSSDKLSTADDPESSRNSKCVGNTSVSSQLEL